MSDQGFVAGCAGDAESVEGNVPDKFFPLRLRQVVRDLAGHAGIAKHYRQLVRARSGLALELAQHNRPVFQVMDDAGFEAIEADEAESVENLFRWKAPRQLFRIAQTVLQCDDGGLWPDQGRQQFWELIVGGRFQSDQHRVADADFVRRPGAFGLDVEIARDAADGHPFLAYGLEIGTEQKMDFLPGATESGTVVAPHGPATDNGDFHWIGG